MAKTEIYTAILLDKCCEYFIDNQNFKVKITPYGTKETFVKNIKTKEDWVEFLNHYQESYNSSDQFEDIDIEDQFEDNSFEEVISGLSALQLVGHKVSVLTNQRTGNADVFIKTDLNFPIGMYFHKEYNLDGVYKSVEIYTGTEALAMIQQDKHQVEARLTELELIEKQLAA